MNEWGIIFNWACSVREHNSERSESLLFGASAQFRDEAVKEMFVHIEN